MSSVTDRERVGSAAKRMPNPDRFLDVIGRIDAVNGEDPKRFSAGSIEIGYELHFSQLLFSQVLALDSEASEALLIAARSQHICRWKKPRSEYPEGRAGYLKWRSDLKGYHADLTSEILESGGYDAREVESVRQINLKASRSQNADSQAMEDALCLVFLEHQYPEFRLKTEASKMVNILRKTWAKMSPRGQEAALALNLGTEESRLIEEALNPD